MPVRSLNSSVLRWPDRDQVDRSVRAWAHDLSRKFLEITRIGYFGSYARGDWGVGSDLDIVVLVGTSDEPFESRALRWDLSKLPVQVDVLVNTANEWETFMREGSRFAVMLAGETVWVYERLDDEEKNPT